MSVARDGWASTAARTNGVMYAATYSAGDTALAITAHDIAPSEGEEE